MSDSAENPQPTLRNHPFYQGWAIILLIVAVAAFFRFYHMGDAPPGLYRDEAYNGLDAVAVLEGDRPIFFESNNGREPLYIYLVAASVKVFGRTASAIRLPAAIIGTLTTLTTYLLTKSWFDRRTALIAAALWAITLWPIHLSRVGFRTILLPFVLSLSFYLLTRAYRRKSTSLFFIAGLAYGLTHYTYLASRLTPLFLFLMLLYMWMVQRRRLHSKHIVTFVIGTAIALAPLLFYIAQNPNSAIGRTGQVSILSANINNGDFWGTLINSLLSTAGMFFIKGDTIIRHNPFGRAVFDWIIAIPFIIGVLWCLKQWRKPAPAAMLLYTATMLVGTVFAEDAPHFLRSAGVLPILLIFPALGLSQLLSWSKLPSDLQTGLISLVLISSGGITFNDYFIEYAQQPDTYYLFEAAVQEMAIEVRQEEPDTDIYVDQRFYEGWSSVSYLLTGAENVSPFYAQAGLNTTQKPIAIYAWPYESRDYVAAAIAPPASVVINQGGPIRGDLDTETRTLYVRYGIQSIQPKSPIANFNDLYYLYALDITEVTAVGNDTVTIDLTWGANQPPANASSAFVHILNEDGVLVGQLDAPPGSTHWSAEWWQPELFVQETRTITLDQPYDAERHAIHIGIYNNETQKREPLLNGSKVPIDDHWQYER